MSLKQAAREALTGNDVEVHAKLTKLRIECRERGIDSDKVTAIIKGVIHEDKQPAAMPEPEAPQPVTPEPQAIAPDSRTDKELSRRAPKSTGAIPEGLTESGTRKSGAAGGRTIFDFIDEKKG